MLSRAVPTVFYQVLCNWIYVEVFDPLGLEFFIDIDLLKKNHLSEVTQTQKDKHGI